MLKRFCDLCEEEISSGNTFAIVTIKLTNCPPLQVDIASQDVQDVQTAQCCLKCKDILIKTLKDEQETTHGTTKEE